MIAEDAPQPLVSLAGAIIIGLLASLAQSFGLTLQRKSHLQNELESQRKKDWQRPLWVVGFSIFLLSNVLGSVFQLGVLPIVVLAPLGGVSLCWNALFAKLVLGDSFSRYLIIGTVLIAGGACLIAIFGSVPEPAHSLEELLALYNRPAFLVWISLFMFALLLALVAAHLTEYTARKKSKHSRKESYQSLDFNRDHMEIPKSPSPLSASTDSVRMRRRWSDLHLADAGRTSPSPLVDSSDEPYSKLDRQYSPTSKIVDGILPEASEPKTMFTGIIYGGASGTMSGLCLLFAKVGTELLLLTLTGHNQFKHWQSWMIVVVLVAAGLLQLWYLNRALRLLGPTLVCPLAFCFYNLSSILNGLVYYDQWRLLGPLKISMVMLGIVILFVGVGVVSFKNIDETPSSPDKEISERTPLMAEPEDGLLDGTFEDEEDEDELSGRHTKGFSAVKRFFAENRPRGFSIGLGASSPGFAIMPQEVGKFRRSQSTSLPHSNSLPHLARVSTLQESTSTLGSTTPEHHHNPRRYLNRSVTGSLYVGPHRRNLSLDAGSISLSPGNPIRSDEEPPRSS